MSDDEFEPADYSYSAQHWVVIERIEGQIFVYDSISARRSDMSQDLKKYIFQLQRVPFRQLNTVSVLYPRAQQQKAGSNHCGLYALVNITELVFAGKPSLVRFAGPTLRSHLLDCVTKGQMSPFSKVGGSVKAIDPVALTINK